MDSARRRVRRIAPLGLVGVLALAACGGAGPQDSRGADRPGGTASAPTASAPTTHSGGVAPGSPGMGSPSTATSPGSAPVSTGGVPRVDCSQTRCVALTFDDGPSENTDAIRRALTARGARATFFLIGKKVNEHQGAVQRLTRDGMEVGNHSYSHPVLPKKSASGQRNEVDRADAAIESAGGARPTLLRPPYGEHDAATDALGRPVVLWTLDTIDWRDHDRATTTRRVLENAKPGSIVLMHDVQASSADAVPAIVDGLQAKGFTLVTASEILGSPQAGHVYGTNALGAGTPNAVPRN